MTILLVGTGGSTGAIARYVLGIGFARWFGAKFPYGTLFINFTGSIAVGWLLAWFSRHNYEGNNILRLLFVSGFLGGYTTFSTFTYETLSLFRRGNALLGWLNLLGSLVAGTGGAALGWWLGNLFSAL